MHPYLYEKVTEWIPKKSRVLDLGTGDGAFLESLQKQRDIYGEGVEINPEMMARCVERGLIMHQGDVLDGLDQYGSDTFDYILLLGTFEELEHPGAVLEEAFRVGKRVVIAYRNFGYFSIRMQLLFQGRAPVTKAVPCKWFDSPTAHFFSIQDFHEYCACMGFREIEQAYFNFRGPVTFWPNMRAEYALSLMEKIPEKS